MKDKGTIMALAAMAVILISAGLELAKEVSRRIA